MGTHPIFESDFDCLTDCVIMGRCLQVIFVFINFLVFAGGVGLTALSIWLLVDPNSLLDLVDQIEGSEVPDAFNDIIGVVSGALYFSLAIGFLGCCGAAKKNKCMLNIFASIMVLLILAEIACVIVAFVYYPQVDQFMKERVAAYNENATEPDDVFNKEFVDQLQTNFECCGWETATEYDQGVPDSCCADANDTNSAGECNPFDAGCEDQLKKGTAIIGGVAAGCVVLEIFALMSACVIRKQDKEYA